MFPPFPDYFYNFIPFSPLLCFWAGGWYCYSANSVLLLQYLSCDNLVQSCYLLCKVRSIYISVYHYNTEFCDVLSVCNSVSEGSLANFCGKSSSSLLPWMPLDFYTILDVPSSACITDSAYTASRTWALISGGCHSKNWPFLPDCLFPIFWPATYPWIDWKLNSQTPSG